MFQLQYGKKRPEKVLHWNSFPGNNYMLKDNSRTSNRYLFAGFEVGTCWV